MTAKDKDGFTPGELELFRWMGRKLAQDYLDELNARQPVAAPRPRLRSPRRRLRQVRP